MSTTPRTALPLLAAAQAQKHVTHNDALLQLDALLFARFLDRDLTAPPSSPADGDTYLVHATASGAWTGQSGKIAYASSGAWRFAAPFAGLTAYVADESKLIVFDGSAWVDYASLLALQNVPLIGVNTAADATNKLAVKSSALLFDNIGNGVQAKLNKNAAGDTASLLYQTGYSGRAEIGLCGDDNFHFKVSPDGAAWTDAVVVDKTSGALTLASSVTMSVPGSVSANLSVQGEAGAQNTVRRLSANNGSPLYIATKGRGTIASPAVPVVGDVLGTFSCAGIGTAGSLFPTQVARIRGILTETGTVSATVMGARLDFATAPIGSATLTEIMRLENETGLSLFGANPVIDQNRAHRLRSTTIAGAVAPSVAGNLFYHSDAQGGAGEVAVDTASAYRHAGQAGVKRLTADADAGYTPRADGRIVRDSAALTANRKLTLATTNVSDGHAVQVSRRGASGGKTRDVYQADGTTLIVSLADNTCADFIYDATAVLWFQK